MRFVLAASLLLGGLAACGGAAEAPPAESGAMAAPPAAAAPPMAGGFGGHYVGTGVAAAPGPHCPEQMYDLTVGANQVSGTVTVTGPSQGHGRHGSGAGTASAGVTGTVEPNGHATLQLHPHGALSPRGTVTGEFANGAFTGHHGGACARDITAQLS